MQSTASGSMPHTWREEEKEHEEEKEEEEEEEEEKKKKEEGEVRRLSDTACAQRSAGAGAGSTHPPWNLLVTVHSASTFS